MVPGMAMAAQVANAANEQGAAMNARIEKSIKASFGGGFSVQAHTQSAGLTYANIEHFGNRYKVASADLLDWKIVSAV
jgi:predicted GNAT superfamily acetyltransferase